MCENFECSIDEGCAGICDDPNCVTIGDCNFCRSRGDWGCEEEEDYDDYEDN